MSHVRFGLIGFGAWGKYHAQAIERTAGAELVAITTRSSDSRASARAAHPKAQIYEDYQSLLAHEGVEVVDIVLPSHLHFETGRAVLEAGKHLLMEKPMALRVEQCNELISLAKSKTRVLAIGHELRLSHLWGKVKEMIEAGAVGKPLYGLIELWRNPYRQGSGGWRYDQKSVGNWILEEPIHFFDLARWYWAQAGEPISVYARANSRRSDRPELQDNFSAVVNFAAGAYVVISQTLGAFEHHQVAKITGTEGCIWATWSGALDRDPKPRFGLRHGDGSKVIDVPIGGMSGEVFELEKEIDMVVRAIRNGGTITTTGNDGKWAVHLCLAAQQSVENGTVVDLVAPNDRAGTGIKP